MAKEIQNKKLSLISNGINLSLFDVIRNVLNSPVKEGMTLDEMRKRISLIELFAEDTEYNKTVSVDDFDFLYLKKTYDQYRFVKAEKDFLEIQLYLETLLQKK